MLHRLLFLETTQVQFEIHLRYASFAGLLTYAYPQVLKAAAWIAAGTRFALRVQSEELPAEVVGSVPLCTSQYRQLLGVSRIPQLGKYVHLPFAFCFVCVLLVAFITLLAIPRFIVRDKFVIYPNARHVAVLSGGQFYKVYVLDESGKPLPESQIVDSLLDIQKHEKVFFFINL
jgi:hypothetical protein